MAATFYFVYKLPELLLKLHGVSAACVLFKLANSLCSVFVAYELLVQNPEEKMFLSIGVWFIKTWPT